MVVMKETASLILTHLVVHTPSVFCLLIFLGLSSAAAEDVLNMDVSILDRIPYNANNAEDASAIANRDIRYRAFVSRQLTHPSKLVHVKDDLVHLTVIASNINRTAIENGDEDQEKVPRPAGELTIYLRGFLRMMFSLFNRSKGTPIHLVIVTDSASRLIAENTIVYSMGKYLSASVIKNVAGNGPPAFPANFLVEFANLKDITTTFRAEIDEMKNYYVFNELPDAIGLAEGKLGAFSGKYLLDLFFIAPFYHKGKRTTNTAVFIYINKTFFKPNSSSKAILILDVQNPRSRYMIVKLFQHFLKRRYSICYVRLHIPTSLPSSILFPFYMSSAP